MIYAVLSHTAEAYSSFITECLHSSHVTFEVLFLFALKTLMMVMILNFFLSTDDANWNPVEWERAAEELTWERVRFSLFSQN